MPAAHMHRANYSRLKLAALLQPPPSLRLSRRVLSRRFATCPHTYSPRLSQVNSLHYWGPNFEHHATTSPTSSRPYSDLHDVDKEQSGDKNVPRRGPSNRFSNIEAPQEDQRQTLNEEDLLARLNLRPEGAQPKNNASPPQSNRNRSTRRGATPSGERPHVRKHKKNKSRFRDASRRTGVVVSQKLPSALEAVNLAKTQKSNYLQWGYIRHQYPDETERLAARRTFNSWKSKFANIQNPKNPSSWPWRDDGKWLFEQDSVAEMRQSWASLSDESRCATWPLVMLSTLHLSPGKAHMVLEATLEPLPPGYAIHDVLQFIAQHIRLDGLKTVRERTVKSEEVLELLTKVIADIPSGHVPFGQRTFGLFARKLPADQAHELYTVLQQHKCYTHPNTLLHFASTLAKDPTHKEDAFSILKDLAEHGADLNEARPSSIISSLLHCKAGSDGWSQEKELFSPKVALQYFMEKGLTPNVINSTAFLDSLCQHSEVEEAIRLALLFAETGVALDKKAWATIFRGAKNSLKVENVVKALDVAKVAKVPYRNVLNNGLHAIFYFTEMESRETKAPPPWVLPLFVPMLRIYAKRFDLQPLQWWLPDSLPLLLAQPSELGGEKFESQLSRRWDVQDTIMPVIDKFFSSSDGPKLRPDSTTIAIMLRSYIKSLQHPYDILSLHSFFKSRLEERGESDPSPEQLVRDQGSLIHDTFIMAMTERRGLARPALQVFGDMLKGYLTTTAASPESQEARLDEPRPQAPGPIHPPPSLCTFSILVHGLLNQGERLLAEQVIQVMREHGVEPNLVTWNTLTKGYASMQNISQTVATLRDMEAAGLKPDISTFKAFGRLKDQSKALKMMEGIIDGNRKKMVEDDLYN